MQQCKTNAMTTASRKTKWTYIGQKQTLDIRNKFTQIYTNWTETDKQINVTKLQKTNRVIPKYGNVTRRSTLEWRIVYDGQDCYTVSSHGGVLGYKMLLQCMYELVLIQI